MGNILDVSFVKGFTVWSTKAYFASTNSCETLRDGEEPHPGNSLNALRFPEIPQRHLDQHRHVEVVKTAAGLPVPNSVKV